MRFTQTVSPFGLCSLVESPSHFSSSTMPPFRAQDHQGMPSRFWLTEQTAAWAVFCIEASSIETVVQLHAMLAAQEAAFGQVNARLLDYMDYNAMNLGP